jgi:hypothetical protein
VSVPSKVHRRCRPGSVARGPGLAAGRTGTAGARRPSAHRPAAAGVCSPAAEDLPAACASRTAAHPGAADSPAPGSLEDRPGAAASCADPGQRRRCRAAADRAVVDAAERVFRAGWEAGRVWWALALSWAATPRVRCAAAAPLAPAGPQPRELLLPFRRPTAANCSLHAWPAPFVVPIPIGMLRSCGRSILTVFSGYSSQMICSLPITSPVSRCGAGAGREAERATG